MSFSSLSAVAVAASAILALALTPAVRAFARGIGLIAKPKSDRWHKKPTAMLGGLAIWLSVVIGYFVFVPPSTYGWVIISASTFLFLVGLADDLLNTKPYQKLIGQVMGSAFVVYYGLSLPWTKSSLVNVALTIFWLIGITNAVNLLDNMDGLAPGIAAIASCFLAISFINTSHTTEALMLMIFAGTLLGFLVYNSNPASIFMGDSGSMFVGFFLASSALVNLTGGRSRSLAPVLAVPVLILFIPIFDTTFVTILRKVSGRAASQGGRDHTSHRLVALGLSERRAVLMLYGFAALAGLLGLLVQRMKLDVSLAAIAGFTLILTFLGVYLAGVKVYDETEEALAIKNQSLSAFLIDLSYKRRIFEVFLDLILILLSYWCAYALKFGAFSGSGAWRLFLRTLPVLVFVKMAAFLATGVYRGIWRYTGVDNLIVFAKGVALSSVLSVLVVLFAFRFEGFSRTIFIIDALLMFMFLAGSRMAFRLFQRVLPVSGSSEDRRVLIYGAGDAGELVLREILNNRALKYSPVGFLDDDPAKKGKVIHGLKVYAGNGDLSGICRQHDVNELLISINRLPEERLQEIVGFCRTNDISVKRMRISIEDLL